VCMVDLTLDRSDTFGCHAHHQGCGRSAHSQDLPCRALADAYVPSGIERRDPRISVLYAALGGLPPTLIQVGSAETLLDDATRFATAAGAAEVAVTLEIWPLWNAQLEPGRRALLNAGSFLRHHL
jgi:epsilon-lactone hydrolase